MNEQPRVEHDGTVTTITFTNGKTGHQQSPLTTELESVTDGLEGRHLILDCRAVTRIHSEELGALIGLHKRVRAAGGHLTLTHVSADIYEVFEITRLTTFMTVLRGASGPAA